VLGDLRRDVLQKCEPVLFQLQPLVVEDPERADDCAGLDPQGRSGVEPHRLRAAGEPIAVEALIARGVR
jgi:hypothetical protein